LQFRVSGSAFLDSLDPHPNADPDPDPFYLLKPKYKKKKSKEIFVLRTQLFV